MQQERDTNAYYRLHAIQMDSIRYFWECKRASRVAEPLPSVPRPLKTPVVDVDGDDEGSPDDVPSSDKGSRSPVPVVIPDDVNLDEDDNEGADVQLTDLHGWIVEIVRNSGSESMEIIQVALKLDRYNMKQVYDAVNDLVLLRKLKFLDGHLYFLKD